MNLFEPAAAEEILSRMEGIKAATPPSWGKMNAAQMMAHCQAPFKAYFGEIKMKRGLVGILFGKMARKKLFSNKPWPQGLPTDKRFRVREEKDFEAEKQKLVAYIRQFAEEGYTITASEHPFFGKMSSQEWAVLGYKHLDHHLKQFGV
jgi:hypothetical protein